MTKKKKAVPAKDVKAVMEVNMGDMAEWLIEQGEDAWWVHKLGQCDDRCQYCEEESKRKNQ